MYWQGKPYDAKNEKQKQKGMQRFTYSTLSTSTNSKYQYYTQKAKKYILNIQILDTFGAIKYSTFSIQI